MASLQARVVTAIPAPDGYVVNFEHPRTQYITESYIVEPIGLLLAFLFLLQRFYVKSVVLKKIGWADVILLVGWGTSVACQVLILRSIAKGWMGIHAWEMPLESFIEFQFWNSFVNILLYSFTPATCKVVILMFYLDINEVSTRFRWSVFAAIFVVTGVGISMFFSSLFACIPMRKIYDDSVAGTCYDRAAQYEAYAVLGVVTDLMIIAIPIPMVISLHISVRRKIGLLALFLVGSLTCVTSLVRLVLLIQDLVLTDTTWGGIYINIWISLEANLLVICASFSTLRLFFFTVAPGLFASQNTTSGVSGGTSDIALETVGGSGGRFRKKRSKYDRFGDLDLSVFGTDTCNVEIEGGQNQTGPDDLETGATVMWPGDNSSEKGIMQTRTTVVRSSQVRSPGGCGRV